MQPSDLTRQVRTRIHVCGCGCWVWTGATSHDGYGRFKHKGKVTVTHRYVYDKAFGDLDDDLTIDHLCDRHRTCCNPEHLEQITKTVNSERANQRRFHDAPPDTTNCTPIRPTNGEGES